MLKHTNPGLLTDLQRFACVFPVANLGDDDSESRVRNAVVLRDTACLRYGPTTRKRSPRGRTNFDRNKLIMTVHGRQD